MRSAPTARDRTRRARILAAAKQLFTDRGLRGTRIDDIAEEVGCAKGAVYLEFPDKDALLREVLQGVFGAIRERFVAQVLPIPSPLDRLVATLEFAFREHAREPLFARLLRDDPELRVLAAAEPEQLKAQAEAQTAQLVGWVRDGIGQGEIRPDINPELVPLVIGVLRHAPMHTPLLAAMGVSGDAVLGGILDIFRAGLAAPAKQPTNAAESAVPALSGRRTSTRSRR